MATQLPAPTSQKAGDRPISFLLDNQADGAPQAFVDLVIRPEELTRVDPSKLTVTQSLGGAWADSFGAGVPSITLSGHTGWRRTLSSNDDGAARMERLKETVFDEWHAQRQKNIEQGLDPDQVRLIFSDALDNQSVVVAPQSFVLRRSKSKPLLAQFQISLLVMDTTLQNQPYPAQFGYNGASAPAAVTEKLGLKSLISSVNSITASINKVQAWVNATVAAPVRDFMNQTAQLFGAVRGAIAAGQSLAGSVIGVAQMAAQAGLNLFRTLAAAASIPSLAKASLMAIAGAYSNIFCVLRNALSRRTFVEDYTQLYGASNCSSTAGGRPESTLAGQNPFYKTVPTAGPLPVTITQQSHGALSTLAANDPVIAPFSLSTLGAQLRNVVGGLKVAS